MKDTLAIDIGTHCGYAYNRGEEFFYGHWDLATKKEITNWGIQRLTRRRDPRPSRLCNEVAKLGPFDWLIFEDITFSSSTYAVQMWASLRTSLWMCLGDTVRFDCVPVQSLKKFACYGNAKKSAMRVALAKKHPELYISSMTEDEIDAVWIWLWAKQNLSRMKL